MNEEKTKIASYVVMFSLHMCSFIFADFQDKPMGEGNVFIQQESLNCQPDCSLLFCVVVVIYLCW